MITVPAAILIFVFSFDGTIHFSSHNAVDTRWISNTAQTNIRRDVFVTMRLMKDDVQLRVCTSCVSSSFTLLDLYYVCMFMNMFVCASVCVYERREIVCVCVKLLVYVTSQPALIYAHHEKKELYTDKHTHLQEETLNGLSVSHIYMHKSNLNRRRRREK